MEAGVQYSTRRVEYFWRCAARRFTTRWVVNPVGVGQVELAEVAQVGHRIALAKALGEALRQASDQSLTIGSPLFTLLKRFNQLAADVPLGRDRSRIDCAHDLTACGLQDGSNAAEYRRLKAASSGRSSCRSSHSSGFSEHTERANGVGEAGRSDEGGHVGHSAIVQLAADARRDSGPVTASVPAGSRTPPPPSGGCRWCCRTPAWSRPRALRPRSPAPPRRHRAPPCAVPPRGRCRARPPAS